MISCYNAYVFTLVISPAVLSLINKELGPDPRYTWITGAWNLGGAIFVTLGGRLSDIFGRRYFFLAGSSLLIVGAIVSVTGQSITQLIVGGALFGAGSGFNEMCYGAVQEIVPNKHRMVTVGVFDVAAIIAQIMPLTVWGIIHTTGSWRAAYYLMIGFQTVNVLTVFFFYNPPAFNTKHYEDGKTKMQLLRQFDWMGMFLFTADCTLLICGMSWGGSLYSWTSATTIAPIVIGFCTLVSLGFWEVHGPVKEALLPPRLFKQVRHFLMPILTMGVAGMQYYSNATLVSLKPLQNSQLDTQSDNEYSGLDFHSFCTPKAILRKDYTQKRCHWVAFSVAFFSYSRRRLDTSVGRCSVPLLFRLPALEQCRQHP